MSVSLKVEVRDNFVELICQGEYSDEAARWVYRQALQSALQHGRPCALVNALGIGGEPPQTVERFQLGELIADLSREVAPHVVIVTCGKAPIIDPDRFGETVSRNRGAQGRVFEDYDEALSWIEQNIASAD